MRSRVSGVLVASTLALSATGLAAPAAVANEGGSYDITRISANRVVVRSSGCINVPFTLTYRTGIVPGSGAQDVDFSADVEVWRGPVNLDSTYVWNDVTTSASTLSLRDSYLYCPSFEGLGTIRLGPSQVDSETYDADYNTIDSGQFLDRTTGSYVAKQASTSALAITRVAGRPRLRQFTVRPRYFSLNASSWRAWARKGVALQRSSPSGWKAVRTIRANARGVGSVRLRVARGGKYRAVVPGTAGVWNAISVTRTAP